MNPHTVLTLLLLAFGVSCRNGAPDAAPDAARSYAVTATPAGSDPYSVSVQRNELFALCVRNQLRFAVPEVWNTSGANHGGQIASKEHHERRYPWLEVHTTEADLLATGVVLPQNVSKPHKYAILKMDMGYAAATSDNGGYEVCDRSAFSDIAKKTITTVVVWNTPRGVGNTWEGTHEARVFVSLGETVQGPTLVKDGDRVQLRRRVAQASVEMAEALAGERLTCFAEFKPGSKLLRSGCSEYWNDAFEKRDAK